VSEVGGEFELSLERIGLFGRDSSSFDLEGETKDVFATNDDDFLEL